MRVDNPLDAKRAGSGDRCGGLYETAVGEMDSANTTLMDLHSSLIEGHRLDGTLHSDLRAGAQDSLVALTESVQTQLYDSVGRKIREACDRYSRPRPGDGDDVAALVHGYHEWCNEIRSRVSGQVEDINRLYADVDSKLVVQAVAFAGVLQSISNDYMGIGADALTRIQELVKDGSPAGGGDSHEALGDGGVVVAAPRLRAEDVWTTGVADTDETCSLVKRAVDGMDRTSSLLWAGRTEAGLHGLDDGTGGLLVELRTKVYDDIYNSVHASVREACEAYFQETTTGDGAIVAFTTGYREWSESIQADIREVAGGIGKINGGVDSAGARHVMVEVDVLQETAVAFLRIGQEALDEVATFVRDTGTVDGVKTKMAAAVQRGGRAVYNEYVDGLLYRAMGLYATAAVGERDLRELSLEVFDVFRDKLPKEMRDRVVKTFRVIDEETMQAVQMMLRDARGYKAEHAATDERDIKTDVELFRHRQREVYLDFDVNFAESLKDAVDNLEPVRIVAPDERSERAGIIHEVGREMGAVTKKLRAFEYTATHGDHEAMYQTVLGELDHTHNILDTKLKRNVVRDDLYMRLYIRKFRDIVAGLQGVVRDTYGPTRPTEDIVHWTPVANGDYNGRLERDGEGARVDESDRTTGSGLTTSGDDDNGVSLANLPGQPVVVVDGEDAPRHWMGDASLTRGEFVVNDAEQPTPETPDGVRPGVQRTQHPDSGVWQPTPETPDDVRPDVQRIQHPDSGGGRGGHENVATERGADRSNSNVYKLEPAAHPVRPTTSSGDVSGGSDLTTLGSGDVSGGSHMVTSDDGENRVSLANLGQPVVGGEDAPRHRMGNASLIRGEFVVNDTQQPTPETPDGVKPDVQPIQRPDSGGWQPTPETPDGVKPDGQPIQRPDSGGGHGGHENVATERGADRSNRNVYKLEPAADRVRGGRPRRRDQLYAPTKHPNTSSSESVGDSPFVRALKAYLAFFQDAGGRRAGELASTALCRALANFAQTADVEVRVCEFTILCLLTNTLFTRVLERRVDAGVPDIAVVFRFVALFKLLYTGICKSVESTLRELLVRTTLDVRLVAGYETRIQEILRERAWGEKHNVLQATGEQGQPPLGPHGDVERWVQGSRGTLPDQKHKSALEGPGVADEWGQGDKPALADGWARGDKPALADGWARGDKPALADGWAQGDKPALADGWGRGDKPALGGPGVADERTRGWPPVGTPVVADERAQGNKQDLVGVIDDLRRRIVEMIPFLKDVELNSASFWP